MMLSAGGTKTSTWVRRLLAVVVGYFAWAIAFGLLESTLRTQGTVATFVITTGIGLIASVQFTALGLLVPLLFIVLGFAYLGRMS